MTLNIFGRIKAHQADILTPEEAQLVSAHRNCNQEQKAFLEVLAQKWSSGEIEKSQECAPGIYAGVMRREWMR